MQPNASQDRARQDGRDSWRAVIGSRGRVVRVVVMMADGWVTGEPKRSKPDEAAQMGDPKINQSSVGS